MTPAARVLSAHKSYGGIRALRGVTLALEPGRVHAVVGENGAGKSTLLGILTGALPDFEGSLEVAGAPRRFRSPRDARDAGVAAIHQELSLVPTLTVRENLFLGRGPAWLDLPSERTRAQEVLSPLGLGGVAETLVEDLPIGTQQAVELARALARDARVLVLDEPTSALGPGEAADLLARVTAAAEHGAAVVYVSHRLDEVLAVADRISVLRDGVLVASHARGGVGAAELASEIAGRALAAEPPSAPSVGDVAWDVEDLTVSAGRVTFVSGVSLSARAGEIVGLFGLRGAGAQEALEGLFGAHGLEATGTMRVAGAVVPLGEPRRALAAGVALVPSDRKAAGLLPDASAHDNAALSRRADRLGLLDRRAERAALSRWARLLRLDPASLDRPAGALSGGNQQKVLLLRALSSGGPTGPRVILACEPTRGVDVGAKADVYAALRALAAEGTTLVFAASEVDELCALAHRGLVLARGRVVAELAGPELRPAAALAAALGAG